MSAKKKNESKPDAKPAAETKPEAETTPEPKPEPKKKAGYWVSGESTLTIGGKDFHPGDDIDKPIPEPQLSQYLQGRHISKR